ncbi:ankyrin repeat-containing domain protein [Nemania serpens]|nr:ankyrin repeat-containing domain protein [Nemania serpens]
MDTSNYRYDPLDPTTRSLRLLRLRRGSGQEIQCELIATTLGEGIQYEAVSYTWGPDFKAATVNIDGKRLPITFNLNLILHDLRGSQIDRILWVDAICIDQGNDVEKGHQVQQMRDIYSSAERVLFCISRPTELTDLLMNSLGKLQEKLQKLDLHRNSIETCWEKAQLELADNHLSSVSEQIEALTLIQRQALGYILAQDWFKRVWIIQEVANARDALVYCGSKYVSATSFVMGTRLLGRTSDQAIVSCINSVQEVLNLMPGPLRSYPDGANSRDLYSILRQFRNAKATDERDRIFALFGLCIDTQANDFPKVDYTKSIMEVIRDTVSYICRCDLKDEVHVPYATLYHFMEDLDSLEDTMILHLLKLADATNALRLLQHAGGPERAKNSWTPLWWAAENGHENAVRLLLEKGASAEAKVEASGMTALHLAAGNGHEDIGADLNAERGDDTPLHRAAENGHEALVGLLLEKGASIEAEGHEHQTPLHRAVASGEEATARLLLERGANIEAKDRSRYTPLHSAAASGHEATARLLIEAGAQLEQEAWYGRVPLKVAASRGHEAIVRLLVQSGANVGAGDYHGETALDAATEGGHEAIVSLLEASDCSLSRRLRRLLPGKMP